MHSVLSSRSANVSANGDRRGDVLIPPPGQEPLRALDHERNRGALSCFSLRFEH
jgi:hypothetical protein